jgi:hypothetical protein
MDTKRFFLAVLSVGVLFSTSFSQNHQVMEKQYSLPEPITGLIIDGAFSVEFTTGDNSSVTVIGDTETTPKVKVETIVSKDEETVFVKISSDDGTNAGKLIIEGTAGYLKEIRLSGLTSFKTKNPIEVDELLISTAGASSATIDGTFQSVAVESSGASGVHLTGTAHTIVVEASGVSEVDISNLEYKEAEINASGVSRISVKPEADNKVTSSGVSSINVGSDNKTKRDEQRTFQKVIENQVILKTVEGNDSTVMNIIEYKTIKDGDGNTESIYFGPFNFQMKPNKAVKVWNKRKNKCEDRGSIA